MGVPVPGFLGSWVPVPVPVIRNGEFGNLKLLLEAGANINAVNSVGESCLFTATYFNRYDIIYYLLEQGADFRIAKVGGWTISHEIQFQDPGMLSTQEREWRAKDIGFLEARGIKFPLKYPIRKQEPWEVSPPDNNFPAYYK